MTKAQRKGIERVRRAVLDNAGHERPFWRLFGARVLMHSGWRHISFAGCVDTIVCTPKGEMPYLRSAPSVYPLRFHVFIGPRGGLTRVNKRGRLVPVKHNWEIRGH